MGLAMGTYALRRTLCGAALFVLVLAGCSGQEGAAPATSSTGGGAVSAGMFVSTYPIPPPVPVSYTDKQGQSQIANGYPGQVQVLFKATVTVEEAQQLILSLQGTIYVQVPDARYYLVGVPKVMTEGGFIAAMLASPLVSDAFPHNKGAGGAAYSNPWGTWDDYAPRSGPPFFAIPKNVLQGQSGIVVLDTFTPLPNEPCPMRDENGVCTDASHGEAVSYAVTSEGGKQLFKAEISPINSASIVSALFLAWSGSIINNPGEPFLVNISLYSYGNETDWYNFIKPVINYIHEAKRQFPLAQQSPIILTQILGNQLPEQTAPLNLSGSIRKLQDEYGDTISQHVMFVWAPDFSGSYVAPGIGCDVVPDSGVLGIPSQNPGLVIQTVKGTSFAAPRIIAKAQQLLASGSTLRKPRILSAAEVVRAMKYACRLNPSSVTVENAKKYLDSGAVALVAGAGGYGFSGDGGIATQAKLSDVIGGVAVDGNGNVYIADSHNSRVRRVDGRTGVITTIAGTGAFGFSGDAGAAVNAQLNGPWGLSLDGKGNLYIVDVGNNRVRRLSTTTGVITTVAGSGETGVRDNNNVPALSAHLTNPRGVAVDLVGNLYISDRLTVRRVDAVTGTISTVVGWTYFNGGYSGDGGRAIDAQVNAPDGLAVDAAGNLYISDTDNQRVRRVDQTTGIITTVAGNGILGDAGDGGLAINAQLASPHGVSVDAMGNLYITEKWSHRVRRVDSATGIISTVAGAPQPIGDISGNIQNGLALDVRLGAPIGIAIDTKGGLVLSDIAYNQVYRVTW